MRLAFARRDDEQFLANVYLGFEIVEMLMQELLGSVQAIFGQKEDLLVYIEKLGLLVVTLLRHGADAL